MVVGLVWLTSNYMLGSGDFGDKSPSQTCDYWYKLAFQKCIGLALLRTKNSYGTDFNNSSVYVWQNNTASKWYRSASIFLRLTKVWSILHHGSVGGVQKKKMLFCLFIFLFHHKICVAEYQPIRNWSKIVSGTVWSRPYYQPLNLDLDISTS